MEAQQIEQRIATLLQTRFHLPSLYPYQQLVIRSILERGGLFGAHASTSAPREQLVVLPTGSGKSVCFMLPALMLAGVTVVVYPLLSLMQDQLRRGMDLGIEAVVLKGGQSAEERSGIWRRLAEGTSRFVITNAETLAQRAVAKRLATQPISLLVIDEAHTVTQWGESFRPAYLELPTIRNMLDPQQVIAFTATASPRILTRVTEILFEGNRAHLVYGNPDRPNIRYRALPSLEKMHDLEMLITHGCPRPALIFCSTRVLAETVARELYLRTNETRIRYYHAGLPKEERLRTENWFFSSIDGILAATSAYGLGVDKRNIRTVIHLSIPADVESFLQESGRAGRDGTNATSIVLIGTHELAKARSLAPSDPYRRLFEVFHNSSTCRRTGLLDVLGFPSETCDGCDVCANRVVGEPDGAKEILTMIRRNPLRYTVQEAASVLCKRSAKAHVNSAWHAVLTSWEQDDLERAIFALVTKGDLRRSRLPLLRGLLYVPRDRAHSRLSLS